MGGSTSLNSIIAELPPDFPNDFVFFHLKNCGNTCFCNSVLQAFLYSSNITDYINHLSDIKFPKEFINTPFYQFINIFSKKIQFINQFDSNEDIGNRPTNISRDISISPSEFLESIYHETNQFIKNQQNDSHEFLIYLISSFDDTIIKLQSTYVINGIGNKSQISIETKSEDSQKAKIADSIESDDNNNSSKDRTISKVHDIQNNQIIDKTNVQKMAKIPHFSLLFEGSRSSSFECAYCHHIQEKIEKFTYLDIGIPLDNSNRELDLQRLIDISLDPDKISAEEGGWVCSGCGKKGVNVEITSYIKDLPMILVIQLQRFKFSKRTQIMEKISKFVKIQNKIHLNSGVGPQKYKLKTIICHIGSSLYQGHFIALHLVPPVKAKVDQKSETNNTQSNDGLAQKEDYWILASDTQIELHNQTYVDLLIRGKINNRPSFTPYVMIYEISN